MFAFSESEAELTTFPVFDLQRFSSSSFMRERGHIDVLHHEGVSGRMIESRDRLTYIGVCSNVSGPSSNQVGLALQHQEHGRRARPKLSLLTRILIFCRLLGRLGGDEPSLRSGESL